MAVQRRNAEGEIETLVCPRCHKEIEQEEKWYGRGWCGGLFGNVVTYVWRVDEARCKINA